MFQRNAVLLNFLFIYEFFKNVSISTKKLSSKNAFNINNTKKSYFSTESVY